MSELILKYGTPVPLQEVSSILTNDSTTFLHATGFQSPKSFLLSALDIISSNKGNSSLNQFKYSVQPLAP